MKWSPSLKGIRCATESTSLDFRPEVSDRHDTLFEHCARGLDQSLAVGSHGLPLIGTGDWNDGLSRVGEKGLGESIWLGWFLHAALTAFARLADGRDEQERAVNWRRHTTALAEALEREAWDGDWYRRAYYDDGTPLGSASSSECRIDSIAQSWSVMSRAADPTRSARAMAAVEKYLSVAMMAWSCSSPRLSTKRRSTPGTSKRIRPASAKTVANTRTLQSGR